MQETGWLCSSRLLRGPLRGDHLVNTWPYGPKALGDLAALVPLKPPSGFPLIHSLRLPSVCVCVGGGGLWLRGLVSAVGRQSEWRCGGLLEGILDWRSPPPPAPARGPRLHHPTAGSRPPPLPPRSPPTAGC